MTPKETAEALPEGLREAYRVAYWAGQDHTYVPTLGSRQLLCKAYLELAEKYAEEVK